MSEDTKLKREGFLKVAILGIGGFIGFSLGIPAVEYVVSPARTENQSQEWIRVGSASKVEVGTPTLFKIKIERTTGWIKNEEELSVYVLTEDGRDYVVMSNICTHLGCRIRWIAEKGQFFCPCHNGVFNKNGDVVSGPPPKPLNRYEVKIENNEIFVLGS
jgi:quinol---cytochrome c reductase iron-sulfur subunit, bacillus type